MRRTSIVAAVVAITGAFSMAVAFATPPTGDVKFRDYARAQLVDSTSVPITGGSNLVSGLYSLAAGGETGWRSLPGTVVLAVTKGTLTVQGGEGCASMDYAAGQAPVVRAGTWRVHNPGNNPVEFFGVFFDQAAGAPKPLVEGPTASPPAKCPNVMAAVTGPSGVSLNSPATGTVATTFYSHHATLDIKGGQDVFATQYDFAPGFNSGWLSHRPAIAIVEAGTLSYVEAKDGKCDESEEYHAGQAFHHPAHRHMAVNKGKEHVVFTVVYFGLPHDTPLPAVGNELTAVDFTQAPPADCPRLH
jgi:quercetin dioxygenase-like cupin family protein